MPAGTQWLGGEPVAVERLCARGPLLVHFLDVGHLSSVRTLPYLAAWQGRYAEAGLSMLAVNSPRFPFTGDPAKLAAAVERLELPFPVARDHDFAIWRAYGCHGWPSLFLWGRGGTLRWYHFGEGEYAATERAIQELLPEDAERPEPLAAVRPSDAPEARVLPPSPEVFPGGDPGQPLRGVAEATPLELTYEGAGAAITVDGAGELAVSEDGASEHLVSVAAPGLYELAGHPRHGRHSLRLRPSPGLAVYCIAFAPGVP